MRMRFGLWMLLLFLAVSQVRADMSLGVSPAEVVFPELYIDGYASSEILVSTADPEEVAIAVEVVDGPEWLSVHPESALISRGHPARIAIVVQPEGAEPRAYDASITIRSQGGGSALDTSVASAVSAQFTIPVRIPLSGEAHPSCEAYVAISPVGASSKIVLDVEVENSGNVRLSPQVRLDVVSLGDSIVASHSFSTAAVRAYERGTHQESFQHTIDPGQYWALASIPACGYFRSVPITISDSSSYLVEMLDIASPESGEPGELIPIAVRLYNPHDQPIDATYIVDIYDKDGELETIRSETVRLDPGEYQSLSVYFRPKAGGTYTLKVSASGGSTENIVGRIEHVVRIMDPSKRSWQRIRFFLELVVVATLLLVMLRLIWRRRSQVK